jgi:hypothetical protein
MLWTVRLSIIRSSFTVHSAMVYVIQVCRELSSRSICSCSKAIYKPVWHIPVPRVQWMNSWWWSKELPETCRVSCWNKFEKLVHLFGFIVKKFVTMLGHTNVKFDYFVHQNKRFVCLWMPVSVDAIRTSQGNINGTLRMTKGCAVLKIIKYCQGIRAYPQHLPPCVLCLRGCSKKALSIGRNLHAGQNGYDTVFCQTLADAEETNEHRAYNRTQHNC